MKRFVLKFSWAEQCPEYLSSWTRCFLIPEKGHGGRAGGHLTRVCVQSVIALCEEKMQLMSSWRLCRSLSAVGRRVLSIESFGAFQGEHATRMCVLAYAHAPRRAYVHTHTCMHDYAKH